MSDKPLAVYIAHPLSGDDAVANQRKAAEIGLAVRKLGHYPFVPHLSPMDFLADLSDPATWEPCELTYDKQVWGYDAFWLCCCNVLLLCGDWAKSEGCRIERLIAFETGIPVVMGDPALLVNIEDVGQTPLERYGRVRLVRYLRQLREGWEAVP